MNEKFIIALRTIALLGGMQDYIAISSRELGDRLDMSQQSASKRILELLEEGLIQRDLGARRQRIKLTEKGINMLRQEYLEYQKIFELKGHVVVHGVITTGMGEGQYYVHQPIYKEQFSDKLEFMPYEGTLNVQVDSADQDKLEILQDSEGVIIDGFELNGRTFGDVKAFPASIHNISCAVVMPARSHYSDVIEILCKYHLRRTLGIGDGDPVEIIIDVE
jgi:riboflavin kinase, archaea type